MFKKSVSAILSIIVCCVLIVCSVSFACAIDDKYYIEELGLTLKIPKEYYVVTRTTDKSDEAFSALSLNYDNTMIAFETADIYLQAFSDDGVLKIDLTMTSDDNSVAINNYSELSSAQRQSALDTFISDKSNDREYTNGVEKKHNGNIYFDLNFVQNSQSGAAIHGYLCNTVINGMNINLTTTKSGEELTADEIKIATNIADSIDFDKIYLKNGPTLDWWRILLWILILVIVATVAHHLYRRYNKKSRSTKKERPHTYIDDEDDNADFIIKPNKEEQADVESKQQLLRQLGFSEEDDLTFNEMLGYDNTDYYERANTDIDTFDVKVKNKNRSHGVSYFEDSGKDINKKGDYFDDYFAEDTQSSSSVTRLFSNIVLYVKLGFKRLSYFCINLSRLIFPSKKSKRKTRKK